jgi:DNA-binding transcriptional MerR regulator
VYSIKQASVRSGVSVPLIRAWERRYGLVAPERTASGYRLYDEDAIDRLRTVRELVDEGWSPSEASRAVLAGEVARPPALELRGDGLTRAGGYRDDLIARFISAAIDIDPRRTATILDEMFAQGSFEAIVDDLVMPAAVALGEAWDSGLVDVAGEHAATAAIERRLSALFEAAAAGGVPRAVVGLAPGGRHSLGALAFAVALRRLGIEVTYLGADVPVSSWAHVMSRGTVTLAVVGVVTLQDRVGALAVASALRSEGTGPVVAVGGRYARWDAVEQAGITVLPERINEAAAVAARLARGGAVTPRT